MFCNFLVGWYVKQTKNKQLKMWKYMKNVLFLVVSVLALTSCKIDLGNWGSSEHIEPSDEIVSDTYKLAPYEEVNMNCLGIVELIQSEEKDGTVELTAPENYAKLLRFESKGSKLEINFTKKSINVDAHKIKIKVYTNDLVKIQNSGAAGITMEKLDTDKLKVVNSGVGEIRVAGITDDAELICSGVGSIEAKDLKALNVKATVSGVGSISCYASEKLDGKVSGVGSLKYAGHPKQINKHRSGVGSISEM